MKRIMLRVAYDGTNYRGWQIQPNGVTIEAVLNRHLSELLGEKIAVVGASRTDSGVHALGNVAVFDTNARMPAEKISFALNTRLPEDIRVVESREVPADFHPRRAKSRKTYEYRILNRTFPLPTERLYSHFCYIPLDVSAMDEAGQHLVGEHDFASFCSAHSQAETTVRTIESLTVTRETVPGSFPVVCRDAAGRSAVAYEGGPITIRVTGAGFLYNMVRIIAGTLIDVGKGAYPPEHVKDILAARARASAGDTAPARGLTLVGIQYEGLPPMK